MSSKNLDVSAVQAAHDAQFTLDSISDLEAVMERRTKAAEVGLATFEVRQYIPYGARPEETLNLFPAPTHTRPRAGACLHPRGVLALHEG